MKKNKFIISLIENEKILGLFNSTNKELNNILQSLFVNDKRLINYQLLTNVRKGKTFENGLYINSSQNHSYDFIYGYKSYLVPLDDSKFQHLMLNYIKCDKNNELYCIDHFYKIQADFWYLYENSDIEKIILSIPE
ncbi:hypothetical protein [Proteus mirabilis]|uniref:hypothetical protein n=1 Tax=Proteus mirabilis TaxID=584 RepID=UPI0034D78D58